MLGHILIILQLLSVIFVSCGFDDSITEILYENAIKKTVEIRSYDTVDNAGFATGCIISQDGQILTNKHAVTNNDKSFLHIEVRLYDSDEFLSAKIVKLSATEDLAIIRIEHITKDVFNVAKSVKGGASIYTIGNPNGFGLSFAEGKISSPLRLIEYNGQIIKTIQTSIVINEGNSGGPLFNADGDLVGLMCFRLRDCFGEVIQGVSFAIHYSILKQFLSNNQ